MLVRSNTKDSAKIEHLVNIGELGDQESVDASLARATISSIAIVNYNGSDVGQRRATPHQDPDLP